jgi:hypothetical protein
MDMREAGRVAKRAVYGSALSILFFGMSYQLYSGLIEQLKPFN